MKPESNIEAVNSNLPLYLPARDRLSGEPEKGPLGVMLAQVVRELDPFFDDKRRSENLPEAIGYLRNPESGILIMVSRRGLLKDDGEAAENAVPGNHLEGYFAEAYQEVDEIPTHCIRDPRTIWQGVYERIEVTEKGDSVKIGITPTDFTQTERRVLNLPSREFGQHQLPAVDFSVEDVEQLVDSHNLGQTSGLMKSNETMFSQFFQISAQQEAEMRRTAKILRSAINRYFGRMLQGFSDEIGLEHFIATDEGETSRLLKFSSRLGLVPHTIPFWHMATNLDPYILEIIRKGGDPREVFPLLSIDDFTYYPIDPIGDLRKNLGKAPLVVTIDGKALQSSVHPKDFDSALNSLRSHVDRACLQYPLFSIIELREANERMPQIVRERAGSYTYYGDDADNLEGLFIKIGVDYSLTRQVRGIASLVRALG